VPAAHLAHELANLLDASLRNVGLVLSDLRGPERPDQATPAVDDHLLQRLETVSQGLHQMATLVHRWMDRPSDAELLRLETRTLGQVIEHATRLLEPAAVSRKISITVSVADHAAHFPAGAIYPVLANALRNSIEAIAGDASRGGAGGAIEVQAAIVRGELELTVADDGPGLSPLLFDSQGHFRIGVTSKPNGHGLGLTLCRDIADRLGGTLEIANRAPHGALLRLRLPLPGKHSRAGHAGAAGAPTSKNAAAGGGFTP
jgi:signal transduction histidine kinase